MKPVRSLFPTRKAASIAAAAALAVCATGVTGATAAGKSAQRPLHANVTGTAEFRLPYLNDDDIRSITVEAHAAPYSRPIPGSASGLPTDAYGTVRISHSAPGEGGTVTATGTVDCLVTAPGTATLTAVITEVSANGPDWLGVRLGVSVQDGGEDKPGKVSRDRVGFSWDGGVNWTPGFEAQRDEVNSCLAPAPFAPVTKGGYQVRHADLPLWPKG
ncbi:hypothetical protein [Streptomyces sp. NPDC002134]|uniref:hypothetical protein n=1 Tax=Streptomyces sp. NPDC002134 TaxID=3364632 RepID=UPI0036C15682